MFVDWIGLSSVLCPRQQEYRLYGRRDNVRVLNLWNNSQLVVAHVGGS